MNRVFIDIDTQYDFIDPNGSLYVKNAETIVVKLKRLTKYALKNGIPIISTIDTHVKDDPEFKEFPTHCLWGTIGHKKISETTTSDSLMVHYDDLPSVLVFNYKNWNFLKPGYNAFSNPLFEKFIMRYANHEMIVYGVATDYCVKHSSLDLINTGFNLVIVEDAIMGVAPDTTGNAIEELKKSGAIFKKVEEIIS